MEGEEESSFCFYHPCLFLQQALFRCLGLHHHHHDSSSAPTTTTTTKQEQEQEQKSSVPLSTNSPSTTSETISAISSVGRLGGRSRRSDLSHGPPPQHN